MLQQAQSSRSLKKKKKRAQHAPRFGDTQSISLAVKTDAAWTLLICV